MFRVSHLSSACILIKTNEFNILCDPVLRNPHYEGWLLYPSLSINQFQEIPLHYIFISHIHEDHYDSDFIKKIINQNKKIFGFNPKVLIAERENTNYLSLAMKRDGLSPLVTSDTLIKENNEIKAISYSTGNPLDIDSILFVKQKNKTFLNLNDIIFEESSVLKVRSELPTLSIDLLATSYAGAGPYPQCYFDENEILNNHLQKVSYNKNKLLKMIKIFNPSLVLPFAGEHFLTGTRYKLNPFRGYYDRFQTRLLDSRCKPLSLFSTNYIDIDNFEIKGELNNEESSDSKFLYYENLAKSLDIKNSIVSKDNSNLNSLIEASSKAFLRRINKLPEKPLPYKFNFIDSKTKSLLFTLQIFESNPNNYTNIFVDKLIFKDILQCHKHWDNIFGGSIVDIRRYGNKDHGYKSEPLLAFFHK